MQLVIEPTMFPRLPSWLNRVLSLVYWALVLVLLLIWEAAKSLVSMPFRAVGNARAKYSDLLEDARWQ